MVGRLIPVDGPKLEAEIQAVLADVRALVAENVRLRDAIRKAAPTVCSMLCPSQWRTGARPPHHPDCEAISAGCANCFASAMQKPYLSGLELAEFEAAVAESERIRG